jgi:NAD(P)H-nitrite reductase large subunit
MEEQKKGRAELPQREWVEFQVSLDSEKRIQKIEFKAWGCHDLIETARRASFQFSSKKMDDLKWEGSQHWDLLISEAFEKIKGTFKIPVDDPETCHCRKITTARVDEAIVLGAHTPERVTKWTTASSGCGTCRPVVEKIIAYRLKKEAS